MQTQGDPRPAGWPEVLRQALIEVPCQGCNATLFTMPLAPGARHAYECPRCHAKTYAAVDPAGGVRFAGEDKVRKALTALKARLGPDFFLYECGRDETVSFNVTRKGAQAEIAWRSRGPASGAEKSGTKLVDLLEFEE